MPNHTSSSIRIEASNYGPIADAKIDLRPLTVFVGPSNTGKSYLAILIYALHRFFSGDQPNMAVRFASSWMNYGSPFFHFYEKKNANQTIQHGLPIVENWFQQIMPHIETVGDSVQLPHNLAEVVRPHLQFNEELDEKIHQELARCFGRENAHWLVRYGQDDPAQFAVRCGNDSTNAFGGTLDFEFNLARDKFKSVSLVPEHATLCASKSAVKALHNHFRRRLATDVSEIHSRSRIDHDQAMEWRIFVAALSSTVGATMIRPLSHRAHYLPADRTGVMHSHRTVVASMVSLAPMTGLGTDLSVPNFSGVLADFLNQLLSLGSWIGNGTDDGTSEERNAIEERMLSGAIQTDQSNPGFPSFSYKPNGWRDKIPLMNSSSMVSELAPIVLYLRHIVEIGDVLIIEEPESNLHPAMQVELVRQLATVVKSGVRVILTTHSEWVLDALANLVHLSDLDNVDRTGPLENEPALDRDDVGVWLFEPQPNGLGSCVKELPLDVEEGGFATGFAEIARLTYNEWADIENLLAR